MAAIPVFMAAILSGMLLAHILWPERRSWGLMVKAFLGAGLGLGLRSLLYFVYLLILPDRKSFIYLDLAFLAGLAIIAVFQGRRRGRSSLPLSSPPHLTRTQRILVLLGGLVFVISLLGTASYLLRRRQGDWDAWMMYNRAARFLYFDQAHWTGSFSPEMDPIFHADYPLLLAANIAAGWEMLAKDSAAVPMVQSALFAVACVGLVTAALVATKSIGQAALGMIILWGVPVFVNEGARQMADVPMALFILATGVLLFLHVAHASPGLPVLAGMTAGLAAWTKNEGTVLVLGAFCAVLLASAGRQPWRAALRFMAGAALPLAALLFFRLFLASSGDILSSALGGGLSHLLDTSRHVLILRYLWFEITGFGAWGIPGLGIGIIPLLALYYVVFRSPIPPHLRPAFAAGCLILAIQMLGYYAAYLVSPYDLAWHLSYSSTRVVLQLFPFLLFLVLCAGLDAESVFAAVPKAAKE